MKRKKKRFKQRETVKICVHLNTGAATISGKRLMERVKDQQSKLPPVEARVHNMHDYV